MNAIFGTPNKKLEEARENVNLSRKEVAIELGLRDTAQIRDWEHGLIVPQHHRSKLIKLYRLDR